MRGVKGATYGSYPNPERPDGAHERQRETMNRFFSRPAPCSPGWFASAEAALSGDGRTGMIGDGNDVQFSSRARVKFT